MKKRLITSIITLSLFAVPSVVLADIQVILPSGCDITKIDYFYAPIQKLATAKSRAETGIVQDEVVVSNEKAVISIPDIEGGCRFGMLLTEKDNIDLFAAPGENISVKVNSLNPFDYTLKGTAIVDGMMEIKELDKQFNHQNDYNQALVEYMLQHQNSPSAAYALMKISGQEFLDLAENPTDNVKNSILYPLIQAKIAGTKEQLEAEQRQRDMEENGIEAPGFTLKDLQGKDVSLSEFKGKWVILDFWGSWCIWCIKGFPELKEAYEKYKEKLEIIGIDCNESEEAWKAGVEKYQLPWVNVYCPKGNPITSEYGVQGFPTKAIIDPQGRLRNITTGHNPEFFNILDRLLEN